MEVIECQCDCGCNAFLYTAGMGGKIFGDPVQGFIALCGNCFKELVTEQNREDEEWDSWYQKTYIS